MANNKELKCVLNIQIHEKELEKFIFRLQISLYLNKSQLESSKVKQECLSEAVKHTFKHKVKTSHQGGKHSCWQPARTLRDLITLSYNENSSEIKHYNIVVLNNFLA